MFIKNSWYIAALAHEIAPEASLARTILNLPVVIFRGAMGSVHALHDQCPHRFAPLSKGKIRGDTLQCGYHGMVFNSAGECINNPVCPTTAIPPAARVISFPVLEKHGLIWLWPGEPAMADPGLIPDYHQYDDPAWTATTHYMHVKSNYLLLIDNLMDLSHIAFVHADILGNDDVVNQEESETLSTDHAVIEKRMIKNGKPIPVWRDVLGDQVDRVDLWMDIHWQMASNIILDVGSTPTGLPRDKGAGIWNLDCLTPETETTTHYFFGHARQYARHDGAVTKFWSDAMHHAFSQDKDIIEAVQLRMQGQWNIFDMTPKPVINQTDRAAVLVRRKILNQIRKEA